MPTRGSIPGRLGSFILGHILCSVLYFFFAFLNFRQTGPTSSTIAVVQIYLLPAALYLLAGCLFGVAMAYIDVRVIEAGAEHYVRSPNLFACLLACGIMVVFAVVVNLIALRRIKHLNLTKVSDN